MQIFRNSGYKLNSVLVNVDVNNLRKESLEGRRLEENNTLERIGEQKWRFLKDLKKLEKDKESSTLNLVLKPFVGNFNL